MQAYSRLRIVSGGQTGVDRAALDVALALGLTCGGWVPRGRRAEDGPVADRYPMREAPSRAYGRRTLLNVRDSDATLVLSQGAPTGGTALTAQYARRLGKPLLLVDLAEAPPTTLVRDWLARHRLNVLNVAGPRESGCPGIYAAASTYLAALLGDDN